MKTPIPVDNPSVRLLLAAALALLVAGCGRPAPPSWQGYLEGEYVYVSSPLAGRLETLSVAKGERVAAGAPLFSLERGAELAAQREAADAVQAARERLDDLRKGSRPTELAALEARAREARATAELSRLDFEREKELFGGAAVSASDLDHARLAYAANREAAASADADLATARLGGRADAVAAAKADADAAAAAKARADWNVAQKIQAAPAAALVYDTLYRPGEYVAAGSPVVALLPPANLKVRFFVPEGDLAGLKEGERILVAISGLPRPIEARIDYLSPEPEYTPPILYNRENRAKLVFMAEGVFAPPVARDLHPGQPADVALAR